MYGDVAAIAAGALANCRARNLNYSCTAVPDRRKRRLSLRLTGRQIYELALEYMQWRRRFQTRFKTGFQIEVNLSIGLKPDFRAQI